MANERKIEIVISADGSRAVTELNKVTGSVQKMEADTGGLVNNIKRHWMGISAGIAGAMYAIHRAWGFAEMAAAFEEQKASLNSLASQYGMSADSMITDIKRVSMGLIAVDDAARIAGTGLAKNLKPDQIINLAEAAEVLSNVTGQKVPQAFESLVNAVATGRERAMEMQLGIIDLNASLGEQASKLNDTEKAAARYNILMEKVKDIQDRLGPSIDSSADRMDRLRVTMHELQLLAGTVVIRVMAGLTASFYGLATSAVVAATGVAKINQAIGWLTDNAGLTKGFSQYWGDLADKAWAKAQEYSGKADDAIKAMTARSSDIAAFAGKINSIGNSAKVAAGEVSKLNEHIQELINKDLLSPVKEIEIQAEKWRKAGADRILIEQWVTAEMGKLDEAYRKELDKDEAEWMGKQQAMAELRIRLANEELETKLQIQEKMDAYSVKAGTISEVQAIERRFQGEREILASRQRLIYLQMQGTEEEEKLLELHQGYYRLDQEITANEEYQAYELDAVRLANQEKYLELQREEIENQRRKYEEMWAGIMDMASRIEGEAGRGIGMMMGGLKGLADIKGGQDPYIQEEMRALEHYIVMDLQHKDSIDRRAIMDQEYAQFQVQLAEITERRKMAIAGNAFGAMAGMMHIFYAMSGEHHKGLFALYKAFSIAQAIMNTYEGATKALSQGGFFGIAMAAMVIATGMGYVAQIQSMKPGGATSASSIGGGGYSSYTPIASPVTEQPKTEEGQVINVHIYTQVVGGDYDEVARELMQSIRKAQDDRV